MGRKLLIVTYFNKGYLNQRYYENGDYYQPYSAEDRLKAANLFYADYMNWKSARVKCIDLSVPKVDGGKGAFYDMTLGIDRFRKALRVISKSHLSVVYKIVIEDKDIKPNRGFSSREKLYFSDEIRSLLCRGLDELVSYYKI